MERKQELTMKIYPPLPIVVGKAVELGRRQNSVCGLSFSRSRGKAIADELKIFFRRSCKTFVKIEKTQLFATKTYPPLPVVVGKTVVWGRRQNSVCGLSFGRSRGRAIADESKFFLDVAVKHL